MALETKKGINQIILYRRLEQLDKEPAWKMAFQTEHTFSKSRSNDTTVTKDGPVVSVGEVEYELSATSIVANGDTHVDEMSDAFDNSEIIEAWIIDKSEKGTDIPDKDKFKAEYVNAYLSNFSKTSSSEDDVELELEFSVFGRAQKGYATLTNDQADVVQYAFRDTVQATEAEEEA